MADQVASSSSKVPAQRPAISRWVIFKLLGFTAGMFVLPIATYYYTVNGVFEGNGTYAAGAAAGMANIVALTYIITAAFEDTKPKDKKE